MSIDVLATQGAMISATMILTMLSQNNSEFIKPHKTSDSQLGTMLRNAKLFSKPIDLLLWNAPYCINLT